MKVKRIMVLLFGSVLGFSSLQAQEDSVMYARDSAIMPAIDRTIMFFQQAEKPADPAKIMMINKAGKTVSLSSLVKSMSNPDLALADLDNDGKKELLVYQFTDAMSGVFNSAKDEIWVYKNTASNRYQYAGKLVKGKTDIASLQEFIFDIEFYFNDFLCNGCEFIDNNDDAPIRLHHVTIRYTKGKLSVVKGDQELRSMINDNLGKLGERVTPLVKDTPGDGIRKEMAMNLAVYYYSFGKNLPETQRLFYKYYKLADAKKVWAAFVKALQNMSSQNAI